MRMNIGRKLLALLLACGVVPLVAVSILLISVGRRQVEATVEHVHRLEADAAARNVAGFMARAKNRLVMDLEGSVADLSDDDIQRTLIWMLGKQDNLVNFRMMRAYDERGYPIGSPVRLPPGSIPGDKQTAWLVQDQDVPEFTKRVPLVDAIKTREAQISPVYVNARRNEALVAMAVPIIDRLGQVEAVVAGEVSLREVQRTVSDVVVGRIGFAYLVDAGGRAIAHPEFDRVRSAEPLTGNGIVERALSSNQPETVEFDGEGGIPQLGAHAPVYWGGWHLVVQQPAADAFLPVTDMKKRAAYILVVALMASLGLGALYVRSLVGPLRTVMDGMRRIVDGQFDHRLDVAAGDEVGELAGAFNTMGRMLHQFRGEIEAWNRELQERVEAKTKQLEGAQAQLVQSAKLSALGQLGAGVAHELNNPLAGVVGQAALLRRRLKRLDIADAERERLEGYVQLIESESSRCREIVHGLLSFSQTSSGGIDSVDATETIERLLMLIQSNLRSSGITIAADLGRDLPAIEANAHQLQQVLMHVITNAQQAMPGGGTMEIRARRDGDGVAIEVQDSGRGIPAEHLDKIFDPFFTTKDVWQSAGLGLSVCYSIVESHGGRISVESEVGEGSTFTIWMPCRASAGSRDAATERRREPVGLRRGKDSALVGGRT